MALATRPFSEPSALMVCRIAYDGVLQEVTCVLSLRALAGGTDRRLARDVIHLQGRHGGRSIVVSRTRYRVRTPAGNGSPGRIN